MITLHRLGRNDDAFQLNPDLIVTVEAMPDTVVTLTTAQKVLVGEPPEEVLAAIRGWRAEVLAEALRVPVPDHPPAPLRRLRMHAHAG
jgi:flagellar protein FlbD